MRELLAETSDDDVRIGLASMLVQKDQRPASEALLGEVALPYPAFQRIVDTWRLRLAVDGKDEAKAAELAKGLADAPLPLALLHEMAEQLDKIGLKEDADPFHDRALASLSPEIFRTDARRALAELTASGRTKEAVALARSILASPQGLVMPLDVTDGPRWEAIRTLEATGGIEDYIRMVEDRAVADDASLCDALRYAEIFAQVNSSYAPKRILTFTSPGQTPTLALARAAWRRVLAIDPRNRRAFRELTSPPINDDELDIGLLDAWLANDPVAAVAARSESLFAAFAKAKRLPELADRIVHTVFPRNGEPRERIILPGLWTQIASKFAAAGEDACAMEMLRKGLVASDPGYDPRELLAAFVEQLIKMGRRDEAEQALAEFLFPAPNRGAPVLAFRPVVPWSEGPRDRKLALIALGKKLGILPASRARADLAAAEKDPLATKIRMLLRCLAHEPEVLPQVNAWLDEMTPAIRLDLRFHPQENGYLDKGKPATADSALLQAMMNGMTGWEEAKGTMQRMLTPYNDSLKQLDPRARSERRLELARNVASSGNRDFAALLVRDILGSLPAIDELTLQFMLRTIEFAVDLKDEVLVGECGQKVVEMMAGENGEQPSSWRVLLRVLDILGEAGRERSRQLLMSKIKNLAASMHSSDFHFELKMHEAKFDLDRGEMRFTKPIVWLDAGKTGGNNVTVGWDIGVRLYAGDAGTDYSLGLPLVRLDHRFDVEILFGDSVEEMSSLARLPGARACGSWRGDLPATTGFLRVIFADEKHTYFSDAVPALAGADLLGAAAPDRLFPSLLKEHLRQVEGGPAPGGKFISYQPGASATHSANKIIGTRQIKLTAGRDYILSGWLRPAKEHRAELGVRFFDAGGKPVGPDRGLMAAEVRRRLLDSFGSASSRLPAQQRGEWVHHPLHRCLPGADHQIRRLRFRRGGAITDGSPGDRGGAATMKTISLLRGCTGSRLAGCAWPWRRVFQPGVEQTAGLENPAPRLACQPQSARDRLPVHPLRLLALLFCGGVSLSAADWPRAFEAYETLVLKEPADGSAWRQLYNYASRADRLDELAQRWEGRTGGDDGMKYRLMLGWLEAAEEKAGRSPGAFSKSGGDDAREVAAVARAGPARAGGKAGCRRGFCAGKGGGARIDRERFARRAPWSLPTICPEPEGE